MNISIADRPALILMDIQKAFDNIAYWGGQRNNENAEANAQLFPSIVTTQEIFLRKYTGNQATEDFVKDEQFVKELHSKIKSYFGNAFYT